MGTASSPRPAASRLPRVLDPKHPIRSLSIAFCLWKAIVLIVIISCPGLGYDTSSSLLPFQGNSSVDVSSSAVNKHEFISIPLKFVRWDSIYFAHIAQVGYVFEQEWAFSYTYGYLVNTLSSFVFHSKDSSGAVQFAVTAVILSHVAHYLSVLALYRLSANVFGHANERTRLVPFLSAALHIICPAGAFLSAPYGESLFSFLNFTGLYIYSSSRIDLSKGNSSWGHAKLILSGCLFALATTIRSNGVLSGILLAYDASRLLLDIITQRSIRTASVRLSFVIVSGCVVALGLIIPQYLAYRTYCMSEGISRPWCQSLVPSIYGWVQQHYWGVGFLRYWTVSNIPLFLLALPMLIILFLSSFWAVGADIPLLTSSLGPKAVSAMSAEPAASLLSQLAITQFILTAMALTSYHVQIINRISSGYPLWYWYLASQASGASALEYKLPVLKRRSPFTVILQAMVIYALFQAVLFGSFLPPA